MLALLLVLVLGAAVCFYGSAILYWLARGRHVPLVGMPDRWTLWLLATDEDRDIWAEVRARGLR